MRLRGVKGSSQVNGVAGDDAVEVAFEGLKFLFKLLFKWLEVNKSNFNVRRAS